MQLAFLFILHIAVLAAQVAAAIGGMTRRRLYTVLFATLALFQLISTPSLPALVEEFGFAIVVQAELLALAGSIVLGGACRFADRLLPLAPLYAGNSALEETVRRPGRYFVIIAICFALILATMFRKGLGALELTWQEARLDANYVDAFGTLLQFIAFPAIWVAWKSGHRLAAALMTVIAMMLFVSFGSRAALLTLPVVIALDLMFRWKNVRRPVLVVVALATAALTAHIAGRYLRGLGIAGAFGLLTGQGVSLSDLWDAIGQVDISGGEAAIWRYFTFVVASDHFPDIAPLTSTIRWLMLYVPSGVTLGMKPEDVTYTLWWHGFAAGLFDQFESFPEVMKVISQGGYGSLHPLLWGEMWVNGGLVAAPVFLFTLIVLVLLIEAIYALVPPILFTLSAPATAVGFMMVARGNSVIGLGYTAYVLPIAAALVLLLWIVAASIPKGRSTGTPGDDRRQVVSSAAEE